MFCGTVSCYGILRIYSINTIKGNRSVCIDTELWWWLKEMLDFAVADQKCPSVSVSGDEVILTEVNDTKKHKLLLQFNIGLVNIFKRR